MRTKKITCGLDVHKESVFASISIDGNLGEVKEFSTLTANLKQMSGWIKENGAFMVAMESTGIYWMPIWNVLEAEGFKLMLVNPYLIKQMPGRKRDVKDSQWIAQLLNKDMLRGSLIPDEKIRQLRYYSREYVLKQGRLTRILQAMERILEQANIRITSMTSKIESKSVLDIISLIINGETRPEELIKKVHGRIVNSKGEKVLMSLDRCVCVEHRIILKQQMEEYYLLLRQSEELCKLMEELCLEHYQKQLMLLETIPGVKRLAAMQIIAETGADMSVFETSGKLTGWAGLRPRNDESAGKIKSKAILKGNKYLRRIMVQIAWAAARTKGSFQQAKYQRLAVRKGNKKALIAIARKQLTVIWNILSTGLPYNPELQPVISPEQLELKLKYHQRLIDQLNLIKKSF